MIVDAKVDYKESKLVLIPDSGLPETLDLVKPYFYLIYPLNYKYTVARLIELSFDKGVIGVEDVDKDPIIFNGTKYVVDRSFKIAKIICDSPTHVPRVADSFASLTNRLNVRISAHNVRYIVRNVFDRDVKFFDNVPAYYDFDVSVMENIKKLKLLMIDVEVIDGYPKIVSTYHYTPLDEFRRDDVKTYILPQELDELQREINRFNILTGFNLLGFDIPWLKKIGIVIDLNRKSIFDIALTLNQYGSSFQVGSARSLFDVALVLKNEVGITDNEIAIKRKARRILKSKNIEEIVSYNVNDIAITTKIADPFFGFVAGVSAITQIPMSEIQLLSSGTVAEYFLLRYCELSGFIPEYRREPVELKGERVWTAGEHRIFRNVLQVDVKAMYPSFVLYNKIDPTLVVEFNGRIAKFDRRAGLGILYSVVKRFYDFRMLTKKLAKQDRKFKPLDNAVKAILNALAYGVQGKQSGYAIMGNKYCPSTIFYGTRDVQFSTINLLLNSIDSNMIVQGCRPVYSDTDSLFISFDHKPTEVEIRQIVDRINSFLRQFGLEVDVEGVWDEMYIYSKKNYILKSGDKVIIKGSALKTLTRVKLPSCIDLVELVRIGSREDKIRYVREQILNCELHELFIRNHMQVWRLVGKDPDTVKRARDRASRYVRVLTPWSEQPYIYLKKFNTSQLRHIYNSCLYRELVLNDGYIELDRYNAFDIVEAYCLKAEAIGLEKYNVDFLIFDEKIYGIRILDIYYILESGTERYRVPGNYTQSHFKYSKNTVVAVEGKIHVRELNVDEQLLRRLVYKYTINVLSDIGLI